MTDNASEREAARQDILATDHRARELGAFLAEKLRQEVILNGLGSGYIKLNTYDLLENLRRACFACSEPFTPELIETLLKELPLDETIARSFCSYEH